MGKKIKTIRVQNGFETRVWFIANAHYTNNIRIIRILGTYIYYKIRTSD
jgi:hypothetical protein